MKYEMKIHSTNYTLKENLTKIDMKSFHVECTKFLCQYEVFAG